VVESIQEVVWEIESQPRENLLPKEVEEQFSHLMVRKREDHVICAPFRLDSMK